ncbi:MAG: pyruvate dehydrogenase (acetyl-transferring), homodimeric type, partial [Gemmatimonadetes bacterium]|nr:pyruvate dehydrogenase (acetyl-transferring), homodimeric type [Gemmatimonadota bacterium]
HLLASGSIMQEALKAQRILEEDYAVAAEVWSVTSFQELQREGLEAERWNLRHPGEQPRIPYVSSCLQGCDGAFVVASDYVKILPNAIARWFPRPPVCLGTDGFGRSDSREALRRHFEVDGRTIAFAALSDLARQGKVGCERVAQAQKELEIDPDKINPLVM